MVRSIFPGSVIAAVIIFSATCVTSAQNYKIKQTTSVAGQNISSTVLVKGSRQRTESGGMMGMGDIATIEQCDLGRTVQVNDKKKLYYMQTNAAESTQAVPGPKAPTALSAKTVRGGTVTRTSVITDTGERKQMFGLTARHIKSSMTMLSSPDACDTTNMSMETDGWYIDLPAFSCPAPIARNPYRPEAAKAGCQDKVTVKSSGTGKLGFPLEITQTIKSGDSEPFSQSISTLEFSQATLDSALFDVPSGYSLASSQQDLYGRPDYAAMMKQGMEEDGADKPASTSTKATGKSASAKNPGMIRIGVMTPTNKGEDISTVNMQAFLVRKLTGGNVEGVAVRSNAEARTADCDYILVSEFSKLKQSSTSKIGGMFGKVTNTDTSASRSFEAQVDFQLTSLKSGQITLQNKAANKGEKAADLAAEGVLAMEVSAVLAAAK